MQGGESDLVLISIEGYDTNVKGPRKGILVTGVWDTEMQSSYSLLSDRLIRVGSQLLQSHCLRGQSSAFPNSGERGHCSVGTCGPD
jgi:hypothetical protein